MKAYITLVLLFILSISWLVLACFDSKNAESEEIVHDAEYYELKKQFGEQVTFPGTRGIGLPAAFKHDCLNEYQI